MEVLVSDSSQFGGSVEHRQTEISTNQKASNFRAKLEFTQIPIVRPWFAGFFSMRGWTLDELWHLNWDNEVSDGKDRPVGRLVAYPISALFVRNVEFTLAEWDDQSRYFNESIQGGGSVGWGPFSIGGSYSHGTETYDFKFHQEGGAIKIPGIQLIGFINNIIPKAPNLNPDIKPEQLVGGADREIGAQPPPWDKDLMKRYKSLLEHEGGGEHISEFPQKSDLANSHKRVLANSHKRVLADSHKRVSADSHKKVPTKRVVSTKRQLYPEY